MWKNLALVCVLAAGCKNAGVDEVAKKDDTSAESADKATPGAATRTGKIDLGARRNRPSDDGTAAPAAGTEEMQDRRRARIAQFDTDGDGKISQDERKLARHKRAEDMRKQADADNNGKVTADEIAKSNFKRLDPESLDTNKDGDISTDEIEAALESRNKAWGGGRFGAGGFAPRPSKRMGGSADAGSAAKP
jgi:Ca2+-binding EF-hand superfamily protein